MSNMANSIQKIILTLLLFAGISLAQRRSTTTTPASGGRSDIDDFNSIGDLIIAKCHMGNEVNSPSELQSKPTNISVELQIDRFLEIDDIQETFSFNGAVALFYRMPCLQEVYAKYAGQKDWFPVSLTTLFNISPSRLWKPDLLLRNSAMVPGMNIYDGYSKSMQISLDQGYVFTFYVGLTQVLCFYDFLKFPFDRQQCNVTLMSNQLSPDVVFTDATITLYSEYGSFMPENKNWRLLSMEGFVDPQTFLDSTNNTITYYQAKFLFSFQRQGKYYLLTMFSSSFILSLLQLSAFLVPAPTPDRGSFAITVMLAIFVLGGQVNQELPVTPKPVYASIYVFGVTVFAGCIAIYAGAICTWIDTCPKPARRKVMMLGMHWRYYVVIDFGVFIFAFIVLVSFTFATLWSVLS